MEDLAPSPEALTSMIVTFGPADRIPPALLSQMTPMEIILGESLLTPGLQTIIKCHNWIHNVPDSMPKNLNNFKNGTVEIQLTRQILSQFGLEDTLVVSQTVYRMENRRLINDNTEQLTIHACDQSLLDDAVTLVSKPFGCTKPSDVVRDVLRSCAGLRKKFGSDTYIVDPDIEDCTNQRSYSADNIHPFQVIAQQANAALANGNDPSFLHYMTYENLGTHHFRSLYSLTLQEPCMEYYYDQLGSTTAGSGYKNPYGIMSHSFPCDFDLLTDLLNGLDENGNPINSLLTFNPSLKTVRLFGSQSFGCGIGSGDVKNITSNIGSAGDLKMCPDYSEQYVLLRQARMSLLEQNKIALRLIVPFVPRLNVGKVIRVNLYNKQEQSYLNYGTGDYLICSLTHNIRYGGMSTTTLDCVAKSVGHGSTNKEYIPFNRAANTSIMRK